MPDDAPVTSARRPRWRLRPGLALEVGYVRSLLLDAVLGLCELVLLLALALLLATLASQRAISGKVASGLLCAASQLVDDAHNAPFVGFRRGLPARPARKTPCRDYP